MKRKLKRSAKKLTLAKMREYLNLLERRCEFMESRFNEIDSRLFDFGMRQEQIDRIATLTIARLKK